MSRFERYFDAGLSFLTLSGEKANPFLDDLESELDLSQDSKIDQPASGKKEENELTD